jgi:hypothetical protein
MKPNQEWVFTATPDFPRICRELAQTGCAVGLVTMKGERPVTLIDTRAKGVQVPAGVASAAVAGTLGRWRVVAGDQTKAALGVRPVRVEGFQPVGSVHSGAFVVMDLETAKVVPGASAPPSPIGRVVSYGPMPRGPFLAEEAKRRFEAATRSLIGAPVVLTPDGRAAAQRKIQTTIQDAMGPHYSVGVELVGGPFGLTANVKVDESPRMLDPSTMPPYMRSPFDR